METELKLMETEIKQMEIEIERKELEIERKELEIEQKETKLEQKGKEIEQKDAALHKIVQKMLRRNMGIQDIQEITGLSYRAIQQIKSGTEKDPEN